MFSCIFRHVRSLTHAKKSDRIFDSPSLIIFNLAFRKSSHASVTWISQASFPTMNWPSICNNLSPTCTRLQSDAGDGTCTSKTVQPLVPSANFKPAATLEINWVTPSTAAWVFHSSQSTRRKLSNLPTSMLRAMQDTNQGHHTFPYTEFS